MNLASHTNKKHAAKVADAKSGEVPEPSNIPGTNSFSGATRSVMDKYRAEGLANPKREPTQSGFVRMFAAWIIDDDLPFTMGTFETYLAFVYCMIRSATLINSSLAGESKGLQELFNYIKCKFNLPSDTAVRNAIARIFIELHDQLVKKLSVRASSYPTVSTASSL